MSRFHLMRSGALAALAALGLGLGAAPAAEAAIVHLDLDKPTPAVNASIAVDLDGDGADDLRLDNRLSLSFGFLSIQSVTELSLAGLNGTLLTAGPALGFGAVIDGTRAFTRVETVSSYSFGIGLGGVTIGHDGAWNQGAADIAGYLGFALERAGATHYGWAAFDLDAAGAGSLTGVAYETVAGAPITAGRTVSPSQVPLPASGVLLAAGLGALALRRKTRGPRSG